MPKKFFTIFCLLFGLCCAAYCGPANADSGDYSDNGDGIRHYTASPGDSFGIISRRVGYPAELLAAMNNLSPG